MKKNRSLKNALGIFSLVLVALGVGVSSFYTGNNISPQAKISKKSTLKAELNPATYDSVSSSELVVTIRDYTGTSLSRHLNVQFESVAITAYTTTKKDVYFVIDDENYTGDKSNPFNVETEDKNLNGYAYLAEKTSGTKNNTIYFPNTIGYGSRFTIVNTKIVSGCMSTEASYSGLTAIYICDGYEIVESGAFTNVPDTVTIKCQAASQPAGWEDGWTDAANIEWGAAVDASKEITNVKSSGTKSFGEAKDFILGYKGNNLTGEDHIDPYPLTIKYEKEVANGTIVEDYLELPTKHMTNPYDAVGSTIYGNTNSFQFSIDLDYGESIVEGSFEFYNIFYAVKKYSNVKTVWPQEEMREIYNFYDELEFEFPVLEGNGFSHQGYETTADKYITVHAEYESDEAAQDAVNQYVALLNAEVDEENNPLYSLQNESYAEDKYGLVYRRDVTSENGKQYAMFVQLYTYEKHFISYFYIDRLVEKDVTDEEGNVTGKEMALSRNIQIYQKQAAIRPYNWVPEFEQGYLKSGASARYGKMINISDIFDISYSKSSSFLGSTSIGMNVTKKMVTAYAGHPVSGGEVDTSKSMALLLKEDGKYYNGSTAYEKDEVSIIGSFTAPSLYLEDSSSRNKVEINIASVLSGNFSFRYDLTDLNNASLVVSYLKDGIKETKHVKIVSPSPVIELSSNKNAISFLVNNSDIEGVSAENICALGITGITVNIHLYNASSHSVVQNTSFLTVFGNIEVLPYTNGKTLEYFNINIYLLLFVLILLVVFAIGAVALFFYQKNKYKNDEFRRMRPKAFVKTALAVFLGLLLVSLGVNFIILRFAVFGSSVPVFNPIDPFVIAFGIAAAISIGLFIRMFVLMFKANKKMREAKRLHLDKDVIDDGTH